MTKTLSNYYSKCWHFIVCGYTKSRYLEFGGLCGGSIKKARASLVAQRLKHLSAMQDTWFRSLGQEDPLEKEMATHSSILAWRIPWSEEPGGLQSMGPQRFRHDWATSHHHQKSWQKGRWERFGGFRHCRGLGNWSWKKKSSPSKDVSRVWWMGGWIDDLIGLFINDFPLHIRFRCTEEWFSSLTTRFLQLITRSRQSFPFGTISASSYVFISYLFLPLPTSLSQLVRISVFTFEYVSVLHILFTLPM